MTRFNPNDIIPTWQEAAAEAERVLNAGYDVEIRPVRGGYFVLRVYRDQARQLQPNREDHKRSGD